MAAKQMSQESYTKLLAELDDLKINKRKEVSERLKVAILEAHIQELEYTIANAVVIDDSSISVDEIGMSSIITIKRVDNGKVETFTIVDTNHANVREKKISDESPIGKAAMHKKVGDIFIVEAPAGELRFEVMEISK